MGGSVQVDAEKKTVAFSMKGGPMKRRFLVLGLLVFLIFVLLFALAGPAGASGDKKVYFNETSVMWPSSSATPPTPEVPGTWIGLKSWWTGKGDLFPHIRGFLMEGPVTFVPVDPARPLAFSQAYALWDSVNLNGGNTSEKMTSYVGVATADDIGQAVGVWKISAASHLAPDGQTSIYTCDAKGVSGIVEGFLMHWKCTVVSGDPNGDDWYISYGSGSGYYIAK
jgi:hypothetical protein